MSSSDETKAAFTSVRLRIEGRVQGVGFREFVTRQALTLQVDGWVRNRADGTVDVLAAGDPSNVEALIAACKRGPELAQVTNVKLLPAETALVSGFKQLPTI